MKKEIPLQDLSKGAAKPSLPTSRVPAKAAKAKTPVAAARGWNVKLLVAGLAYMCGGMITTTGAQGLAYNGMGNGATFTPNMPFYAGMAVGGYIGLVSQGGKTITPPHSKLRVIATTDLAAQSLSIIGLALAGSGLFVVISSATLPFSLIISAAVLRKTYSMGQVAAVVLVSFGLAFSAMDAGSGGGATDAGNTVMVGVLFTTLSAVLFAAEYVYAEVALGAPEGGQKPTPEAVCMWTGVYAFALNCCVVAVYTVPRWDSLIMAPIAEKNGSIPTIALLNLAILAGSAVLNWGYFCLLSMAGSVATGVLQAPRSVAVFILSHVLFCSIQQSQCLTPTKWMTAVIVNAGVVLYNTATSARAKET